MEKMQQITKSHKLFQSKDVGGERASKYTLVELPDGTTNDLGSPMNGDGNLPVGARPYRLADIDEHTRQPDW